jgi:DNA-binding beta-propeller fold protein YncE
MGFPRIGCALALTAALMSPVAWGYHIAREIRMPGEEGWDYLAVDAHAKHLFVSHGTHVEVVDLTTFGVVASIADTPGVHGIAIADDLNRGYISVGATSKVVVFDLQSLQRLTEIETTGGNPDAILYEPKSHRVFTFNGRGRNATAIDAHTNQVVGTVPLNAKPEFAVADGEGSVFVNLEDTNSLAQVDPVALKVKNVWPLKACDEPTGLAIDRAHGRLFSVCGNNTMAITDAKSGAQIASVPIGANVDGAGFDDARQEAYASGGDGTLTVVKEESPQKFTVTETAATKNGARTMVVDEHAHRLYLSAAERRPAQTPTAAQPHPRPTIVPNTFEVLVLEP